MKATIKTPFQSPTQATANAKMKTTNGFAIAGANGGLSAKEIDF